MNGAVGAGAGLVAFVALGALVAVAVDDAPAGLWVTALIVTVVLSGVAVVVAMLSPTPEEPMRRVRRVTLAWVALTVASSPFAYGAPLLLTVPGLAALVARLYVGPSDAPGRTAACIFLGPAIAVGAIVFSLRADEDLADAVLCVGFVITGVVGLTQLRRQSRVRAMTRP